MGNTHAPIWFAKFGATCAVLLTFCWATPRLFPNLPQFPPLTTDQQQVVVFDRYFSLPALEVVLVGSSLSYRLKEEFFIGEQIRNAALPGASPLTGLAIIGAAPAPRPRIIAVEANILSRAIDNSLFQKFKNARRSDDGFRPLRTAAAYYQRALDDRLTLSDARKQSILNGPAITRNVERAVAATVVEWNKPYFDDAFLKKNANALFSLVETMEAQGVRIFLYQPYLAVVNETLYARMVRKTLAQVFGSDDNRWLNLEYNVDELRWDDGIHLDERSAIILASALGSAMSKKKKVR